MKLEFIPPHTLRIQDMPELTAAQAGTLRDAVQKARTPDHQRLLVDLSQTTFIDSSGLGTLIALHKSMTSSGGQVIIYRPSPAVQQVLELTRLHRVFQIETE